ncbi:MAG: amino acid ABC transporter permease [Geminicoccaceae bacterium]
MAAVIDSSGVQAARPAFYNDPKVRGLFYQALVLFVTVGFGWYLVHNTMVNRARLGVASGFGFLDTTSGFDISQSLITYSAAASTYGDAFVVGLLNTFYVAVVGIVLATIIGFTMGIARLSRNWLVSRVALVYIELIRNIPLLLQLIFWYTVVLAALPQPRDSISIFNLAYLNVRGFFVPKPIFGEGATIEILAFGAGIVGAWALARWARIRRERTGQGFPVLWACLALIIGLPILANLLLGGPITIEWPEQTKFRMQGGLVMLPEFLALALGLSVYTGSFIAEIVRSGILSVSKGQIEAAGALGLSPNQTLRFVVIPQALRVIIPPQTSQYLNLTKNSSLGVAIGYPDFFNIAGTINNQTGQAVEVIAITMAVYLFLSLTISLFMNWYNSRMALVER